MVLAIKFDLDLKVNGQYWNYTVIEEKDLVGNVAVKSDPIYHILQPWSGYVLHLTTYKVD